MALSRQAGSGEDIEETAEKFPVDVCTGPDDASYSLSLLREVEGDSKEFYRVGRRVY